MKVSVIGGGPGGLYFSILLKKAIPTAVIDIYERNKADDAFGFGVVFSDETLSEFLTRDPQSYELIRSSFAYWDDLDIVRLEERVRITGNGFCGCSRKTLLQLLQQRCREEGVGLHFETHVDDLARFKDSDVIVACDGINSGIRQKLATDFGTRIELRKNRFVWMGTTKPLDAFTYFFKHTPYGAFALHSYQYEQGMSTLIFETSEASWQNAGFEETNEAATIEKLSTLFKEELDGHPLISNKSHWRQFPVITNKHWFKDNIVLLGDAKATAHFSIGSGTKLAMECAIGLADALVANQNDIQAAFKQYEQKRRPRVEMIQHAANVSLEWFENMDRYINQPFMQFAFGVMTRSKKVTFGNMALRDSAFTDKVLAAFHAGLSNAEQDESMDKGSTDNPTGIEQIHFVQISPTTIKPGVATPAAFTPFSLRKMTLENRIVLSPTEQFSANEGLPNDWHLVHYAARAIGGVGLILTEPVAISPTGRMSDLSAGIYTQEQVTAWKKITDFIHINSRAKIGLQLNHAGRTGFVSKQTASDTPPDNTYIAASEIPYFKETPAPKAMTSEDIQLITEQFVNAAQNADTAGFDMIELQAGQGYLLGSFLSPLTNIRTDAYGGTISNRIKFPLAIFNAIRAAFNANKPISVSISASDWAENGISESDVQYIAQAFKAAGADILNVMSGGTVSYQQPATGRMWQTPFSDAIRNTVHIPTITSGNIQDIDQINTIILNGRADLVALGRPLLLDPNFVRNAQAYEQFASRDIPWQYVSGIRPLYEQKLIERKAIEGMKKALKPGSHKK